MRKYDSKNYNSNQKHALVETIVVATYSFSYLYLVFLSLQ